MSANSPILDLLAQQMQQVKKPGAETFDASPKMESIMGKALDALDHEELESSLTDMKEAAEALANEGAPGVASRIRQIARKYERRLEVPSSVVALEPSNDGFVRCDSSSWFHGVGHSRF